MRILALETNIEKMKQGFAADGEELLMTIFYSRFIFTLAVLRQILFTLILIAIGVTLSLYTSWSPLYIGETLLVVWILFVFFPIVKRYIHWRYSFVQVTTAKIIVVDQSSIIHRDVTQISFENFASITSETQFWNLFPFGMLHFNLKEGGGEEFILRYIPHAQDLSEKIANVMTAFQRRKNVQVLEK